MAGNKRNRQRQQAAKQKGQPLKAASARGGSERAKPKPNSKRAKRYAAAGLSR